MDGVLGSRRAGNHGTSTNSSSHTESSWRLKGFTEGAVTIGVGSLFQYFTTRVEKDDFLRKAPTRTLQNFEMVTSQARPHWQNVKEDGIQIQSIRKHFEYDYEVSTEATPG